MKKFLTIPIIALFSTAINAQFNTNWTNNTSNSSQNGYIGIGTKPSSGSTVLPNFNFQVHGVANYTYTGVGIINGGPPPTIDYGATSRIGLTNSTTGKLETDGGVLMMSEKNFHLINRESGDLRLSIPGLSMNFYHSTGRVSIGGSASGNEYAKFNINSSDNGVSVKTNIASKYALRLKVANDNSNLIEAFGSDNSVPNFQVTGGGNVYARRYITTLNPFPDYVFQPDYKLRTFAELRTFINTHKHLPNMPTATEVDENGADIGEINRLLVEKVEELTLYVLELEERLSAAESNDTNNESLQKRIEKLEELILELSK